MRVYKRTPSCDADRPNPKENNQDPVYILDDSLGPFAFRNDRYAQTAIWTL
jgi:hypothetical protein